MATQLGDYIKKTRRKMSLSVRDLADKLRKTPGYISRIESRDEIPNPSLICEIADILGKKPEVLLKLAKNDKLSQASKEIAEKQKKALVLYRRSK